MVMVVMGWTGWSYWSFPTLMILQFYGSVALLGHPCPLGTVEGQKKQKATLPSRALSSWPKSIFWAKSSVHASQKPMAFSGATNNISICFASANTSMGNLTSLAQGSSVARCTVTGAVLRSTGSPVLTATGDGAVRSPAALGAHIVTVDAWRTQRHSLGFTQLALLKGTFGWIDTSQYITEQTRESGKEIATLLSAS